MSKENEKVKIIVYCTDCNTFSIEEVDHYTIQNRIDTDQFTRTNCKQRACKFHGMYNKRVLEMDISNTVPIQNELFYFAKEEIYDETEGYFNGLINFKIVKKEINTGLEKQKIIDVLNKHSNSITLDTVQDLNELKPITIIIKTYETEVNLLSKFKKDNVKFSIDGVVQKGWKKNVSDYVSWSEDAFLSIMDNATFKRLKRFYSSNFSTFIKELIEKPGLEILYNAGYFNNTSNCIYSWDNHPVHFAEAFLNTKNKTPDKILNVSKANSKFVKDVSNGKYDNNFISSFRDVLMAIQQNPSFNHLELLKIKEEADITFEAHKISTIIRGNITFNFCNKLYKLSKEHNYDISKLIKYVIEELKETQGLYHLSTAIDTLIDYVEISTCLNIAYDKYPKNLNTEHDKAVYLKLLKGDEYNRKRFQETVDMNTKYNYYDDENYIIISPKEVVDLKAEGAELHHCVGSYVEKYCDEISRIFFMRDKRYPDKPLVTLELNNKFTLVQSSGFGNRQLSTEECSVRKKWLMFVTKKLEKEAA